MSTRTRLGQSAFTLLEAMFVGGLFSLILLLVFQSVSVTLPAQRRVQAQVERVRDATTTLTRLSREMRTSALYHWPRGQWSDYSPDLSSANGPLLFVKNGAPLGIGSGSVVAYWHDPTRKAILRTAYEASGFRFGDPLSYSPLPGEIPGGRVLARNIAEVRLHKLSEHGASFAVLEFHVEGVAEPVSARVRMLPAPGL